MQIKINMAALYDEFENNRERTRTITTTTKKKQKTMIIKTQ